MKRVWLLQLLGALVFTLLATEGQCQNNVDNAMHTPEQDVSVLLQKTVVFGHQSVGMNILDGLRNLKSGSSTVGINRIGEGEALQKGAVNHAFIGTNADPFGKMDSFSRLLDTYAAAPPDIALFKFCYLDVDQYTDISALFTRYRELIAHLHKTFPGMIVVHTTVPLRQVQTGPKAWVKRVIGKPVTGLADNVAREEFNNLIRTEFGHELIYDIAKGESTYPDGGRETFEYKGTSAFALVPQYTDDGEHLNGYGGEILARQFVQVLAQ
ncbi:MAG: hypothetical protein GXY53_09280, partial [Desulfobulbus sp.]|nr:hypothetical protein [Desulfobulbus sp.]